MDTGSARSAGEYDRVLGLDLDGVCSDYVSGFREFAAAELRVGLDELPVPDDYSLAKAGWPFRDTSHYLEVHRRAVIEGLYADLPVFDGLKDALTTLSSSGVHIRIVTHRLFIGGLHEQIITDTVRWLDRNELPYMSLCFTGLKDSVGADLYVEDAPEGISSLRTAGFPVVVFDQQYNRGLDGPRIGNWRTGVGTILSLLGKSTL